MIIGTSARNYGLSLYAFVSTKPTNVVDACGVNKSLTNVALKKVIT